MRKFSLYFLLAFASLNVIAQNETVGLLFKADEVADGYTLFTPGFTNVVYLIDNCGKIVNTWNCIDGPELSVYLLEDGSIIRGSFGFVERRDWNDNLVWEYSIEDELGLWNHHDIEPLPNGNVLIIGAKDYTVSAAIQKGRNPQFLGNEIQIDEIVEIEPTGLESGNEVWRWSPWNHLIQDFDASKDNFGVVADNPEKLDINFSLYQGEGMSDWLHCNGIDYNATLDQIVFSSRHTSEIYIIDHSTTTIEAASNSGGNSGKGGQFLWRWGNPEVYKAGNNNDRKLFGQHDPKWIPQGYPNEGKITVFNNGFQRPGEWSSVHIIDTEINIDGSYNISNGNFLPQDYFWSWNGDVLNDTFWGPIESGVQIQANGNMLVTEVRGRFFEVDPNGNVVWVYINPAHFFIYDQFEEPDWTSTFRSEKYASNYPAFDGKNINAVATIENQNSNSDNCTITTNVEIFESENAIRIQNLDDYNFSIYADEVIEQVQVFNSIGQTVLTTSNTVFSIKETGIYFVQIQIENQFFIKKLMVR